MEKIFYWTGLSCWFLATLFVGIFIISRLYERYKKTTFSHWIDIQKCYIMWDFNNLRAISLEVYNALKNRLEKLEQEDKREFEQRFIKKYIANARIKVFDYVIKNVDWDFHCIKEGKSEAAYTQLEDALYYCYSHSTKTVFDK